MRYTLYVHTKIGAETVYTHAWSIQRALYVHTKIGAETVAIGVGGQADALYMHTKIGAEIVLCIVVLDHMYKL